MHNTSLLLFFFIIFFRTCIFDANLLVCAAATSFRSDHWGWSAQRSSSPHCATKSTRATPPPPRRRRRRRRRRFLAQIKQLRKRTFENNLATRDSSPGRADQYSPTKKFKQAATQASSSCAWNVLSALGHKTIYASHFPANPSLERSFKTHLTLHATGRQVAYAAQQGPNKNWLTCDLFKR